jgi:hypothetical protein
MKKITKVIIALAIVVSSFRIGTNVSAAKEKVSVTKSNVTVKVDETKSITVNNSGVKKIKVTGFDKSIAKVTVSVIHFSIKESGVHDFGGRL